MQAMAENPKPRRGRGRPKLSAEERSARAALVLGARLANKRTEEICAEFRLSRSSVYKAFDHARRSGFLEKARDFLTLDLVPLALAAYEEALRSDNLELKVQVAEKVFDGLGITGKHATLLVQRGGDTESFEAFRARVIHGEDGEPRREAMHGLPAMETVDGVLVEVSEGGGTGNSVQEVPSGPTSGTETTTDPGETSSGS